MGYPVWWDTRTPWSTTTWPFCSRKRSLAEGPIWHFGGRKRDASATSQHQLNTYSIVFLAGRLISHEQASQGISIVIHTWLQYFISIYLAYINTLLYPYRMFAALLILLYHLIFIHTPTYGHHRFQSLRPRYKEFAWFGEEMTYIANKVRINWSVRCCFWRRHLGFAEANASTSTTKILKLNREEGES